MSGKRRPGEIDIPAKAVETLTPGPIVTPAKAGVQYGGAVTRGDAAGAGSSAMDPGLRRDDGSGRDDGVRRNEASALLVRGVSHRFGALLALDNVSLEVPVGGFVVLLGLNGAGKSTLFALVTRLYDNVTGEIRILGHDVRRTPMAALRHLGVVFQSRSLDADLTLVQNLAYHAALHGIGRGEARERAEAMLEVVGLAGRAHDRVRSLSGGQARRVEIARALLHRPECLLLDEATVGLDIRSRESVIALVRELVASERLGVLWATHLIDEIAPGDRIVLLHKGRVLFAGAVPELLRSAGRESIHAAFKAMTGGPEESDEQAA